MSHPHADLPESDLPESDLPESDLPQKEEPDPRLERLRRDRKPGEIESGMLSGAEDGEISATERFEGEVEPEEALRALREA